jgi:hypothetical protein
MVKVKFVISQRRQILKFVPINIKKANMHKTIYSYVITITAADRIFEIMNDKFNMVKMFVSSNY